MVFDECDRSAMRWTVDYPEDLDFVRAVFAGLYSPGRAFDKQEILAFLEQHPEIVRLNSHHVHK